MAIAMALLILLVFTTPIIVQAAKTSENLQISASWSDGYMLILNITDINTMEEQQVAIRLNDFVNDSENVPYILLQAQDFFGEWQSGVIQVANPLFDPTKAQAEQNVGNSGSSLEVSDLPDNVQNIVAEANQAPSPEPPTLTPDGSGTVVDNIMTVNDIEFFTVTTYSGNDFFLVIDRQRTTNNVYLLNAVTEMDLLALAEIQGESPNMLQPSPNTPPAPSLEEILQAIHESTEQNQTAQIPVPTQQSSSGFVWLAMGLVALGGTGFALWRYGIPWYKSLGEKKNNTNYDNDYEDVDNDDFDDDEDYSNVVAHDDEEDFTGELETPENFGGENDDE